MNGDGYPDLLAGNWGLNSKLSAGKDGPLKLYVKDFDQNGSLEQIMTYSIGGQEYPFLGKDQLELALPVLKKKHLSYDEVAGKTVQYMFGDLLKDCVEWKAETLGSACFINDGHGKFTKMNLPAELQVSPIFSFTGYPDSITNTFFAAGNFYGVTPFEGRYDALNPTLFGYNKDTKHFKFLSDFPAINGECRDAKWITCAGGKKILVVARNNEGLIFLKPDM